jgi:chorismate synthase
VRDSWGRNQVESGLFYSDTRSDHPVAVEARNNALHPLHHLMYRVGHADLKTVARYLHITAQRDTDLVARMTRTPIAMLVQDPLSHRSCTHGFVCEGEAIGA